IYRVDDKKSNYITVSLWVFSMGIVFFLLSFSRPIQEPVKYPLENAPSQYSIMIQQFDALQKGQLSFDYQGHEPQFAEIENPYDISQRSGDENWGSSYWDHAYYNNKIYSYFGLAPILTVYYPYYWITGTLPTDATVAFYFAALAITLCFLLIRKCITCFQVKASILDVSLFFLALPAVSHLFLIQGSTDMYYIPLIAVNAFLLLFLYCSLTAYTRRETWHGIVWYAIAGLALGLSVASRPTTIIPAFLLILPLYFHVLWDKKITKIQKTKLVAGFSAPVCISAILIMWYNSARFGSPFDFGAAHQITASDIHYNHLSIAPSRVISYLYQYWFMPFDLSETFPFINFDFKHSYLYGNFTWFGTSSIAVFAIPLNITLLCLPNMITWCKPLYQKAMLLCGFIGCFIIMYIDFCLGGVHMRYSCDASLVFAILSLTIMCYLLSLFRKHNLKQFIYIGYLLIFLSILLDYLLIFVNERNYIKLYSPDIFLSIKHFFSL
ncbi:MAG: hypothetical protein K2J67_00820, partial [Lachnospiraceae bacterium]|nr:hypothetical protein [Lachnospiraceae bacterium]